MLYTPFRKGLRRYARAARALAGHTVPDFLEGPSPAHAAMSGLLDTTRGRMRDLLRHIPEVPPGGLGENGPEFGPVVHPDDMQVAASVQLPLALALDADFPDESYAPAACLREKCVILASAIEVYAGWRAYTVGECRTRWQGFPRQVPAGAFAGMAPATFEEGHLSRLFANLTASASLCRRAVEAEWGDSAGEF